METKFKKFNLNELEDVVCYKYIAELSKEEINTRTLLHEDLESLVILQRKFLNWCLERKIERPIMKEQSVQTVEKIIDYELEKSVENIQRCWRGYKSRKQFYEFLKELANREIIIPEYDYPN